MRDVGLEVIGARESINDNSGVQSRLTGPFRNVEALEADLRRTVNGEVCFDRLRRTIYAADASLYEIVPAGVVFPRDEADVLAAVRACQSNGVPLIPRGAGTGLTGGAVGAGVILDCSRHLDAILEINADERTARVQPGVVLDELNAALLSCGLHFAPDVATSSRATIGGMIANNSCGARSVYYGRTVDHVAALRIVLADGSVGWCGSKAASSTTERASKLHSIESALAQIVQHHARSIHERYPRILRNNGGYGLDRLLRSMPSVDPVKVICGSEGTLAIVTEAILRLEPLPRHRALLVVHFEHLLDSLSATPEILTHQPAAIELVDRMILAAAARSPALARRRHFLRDDPEAILIVEFFAETDAELKRKIDRLRDDLVGRSMGYAHVEVIDHVSQRDVWDLRKAGLGLLMSKPGERQPYEFIEDAAVPPERLREYIERLTALLAEEKVTEIGFYAHASVGCLHVRPVLNLRERGDVERMVRIADKVSSLVLEFGGAMSGEHGDGLVRSCWLEKMYGPTLVQAFREVKRAFDPDGVLNPGKIVDAPRMDRLLRVDPSLNVSTLKTHFDYGAHETMHGLAAMCSGVGQCRQRLVGTMCPSYMATGDETHTTRARANALRSALTNRGLLQGLDDPSLSEVMDLCIGCKACKTECPTGVDVARLKSEWLAHKNLTDGASPRSRLIARLPQWAAWGSRFAPIVNPVIRLDWVRRHAERRYGLSSKIPLPRFSRRTFRAWWKRHRDKRNRNHSTVDRGKVAYFVDTWTNHFVPEVGIATVRLLEASGLRVIVPPAVCCGRPCISKGLLSEAASLASMNVQLLTGLAQAGIPIVGTEPSCILTFVDEIPSLLRSAESKAVAAKAQTLESFLLQLWGQSAEPPPIAAKSGPLMFHGHCHQKAMMGTSAAMELLNRVAGGQALEINSGCCGMAGSFGHEVEHYEVARAIGEQRLFPAVRERGSAEIVVTGFSCMHQIEHHTQVRPIHLAEALARGLKTV